MRSPADASGPGAVLAVDLGGTNLRAAIVGTDGTVGTRREVPTPHDSTEPAALVELVRSLADVTDAPARAVIGVPGRVDYGAQILQNGPNLPPGWVPKLSRAWIEERVGGEVSLANDADLAAVGEAYFGAGADVDDVVYVTISTGLGAGAVFGGRLLAARHSGGEIGHTIIDLAAARGGRWATVEDLGSGTALHRIAVERGISARGAAFDELVRSGDGAAAAVWGEVCFAAGVAVANLVHLFAPEVVVVGGGVGRHGSGLLEAIGAVLDGHGPRGVPPPEVRAAALGDDSALAGAAAWERSAGRRPRT